MRAILLLVMLVTSASLAQGATLKSYTGSFATTLDPVGTYSSGTVYHGAECFNLSVSKQLTGGSYYIGSAVGSPTGDITVRIETQVAGVASGTLAHANLTTTKAVSTNAVNSFTWPTPTTLASGNYCQVVKSTNVQATTNYWQLNGATGNPSADGFYNECAAGVCTAQTWDMYFTVLGNDPPAGSPTLPPALVGDSF